MRGTPLLQAVLIVVVFLLAGVPMYRLTRPAATDAVANTDKPDPSPADHAPAKPTSLDVEVTFAPAPADFQITNLGQSVLVGRGPQARFTGHWTADVPPEGADLVVQSHWPAANPGAMRVVVRFLDGRSAEKTFWADANGTVADVFTVPGATSADAP